MKGTKCKAYFILVTFLILMLSSCTNKFTVSNFSVQQTNGTKNITYGEVQKDVESDYGDFITQNVVNGANGIGVIYRNSKAVGITLYKSKSKNIFKTSRGISLGDKSEKVLKKYGTPTHKEKTGFSYVFKKHNSNFELVKDSSKLSNSEFSKTFNIIFDFNSEGSVERIWIGDFGFLYNLA